MISVVHNGVERRMQRADCANLAELVEACARDESDGRPRAVMSVSVNGCPLPEERLGELHRHPLEGVDSVQIASRDTREVALSSLGYSERYVGEVRRAVDAAVEHLRSGRVEAGSGLCADIADSLGVLASASQAACLALDPDAHSLRDREQELLPWLREVVEAQAGADWVHLADLLEYELAPRLGDWRERIREVLASLGADGGEAA